MLFPPWCGLLRYGCRSGLSVSERVSVCFQANSCAVWIYPIAGNVPNMRYFGLSAAFLCSFVLLFSTSPCSLCCAYFQTYVFVFFGVVVLVCLIMCKNKPKSSEPKVSISCCFGLGTLTNRCESILQLSGEQEKQWQLCHSQDTLNLSLLTQWYISGF